MVSTCDYAHTASLTTPTCQPWLPSFHATNHATSAALAVEGSCGCRLCCGYPLGLAVRPAHSPGADVDLDGLGGSTPKQCDAASTAAGVELGEWDDLILRWLAKWEFEQSGRRLVDCPDRAVLDGLTDSGAYPSSRCSARARQP